MSLQLNHDLKITCYGLATAEFESPAVIMFINKLARLNFVCTKTDDKWATEFDHEIDLAKVPAFAALIQRVVEAEKLLSEMVEYYDHDLSESGFDGPGGSPAKRCRQFLEARDLAAKEGDAA